MSDTELEFFLYMTGWNPSKMTKAYTKGVQRLYVRTLITLGNRLYLEKDSSVHIDFKTNDELKNYLENQDE